jgi:hypothetical protein
MLCNINLGHPEQPRDDVTKEPASLNFIFDQQLSVSTSLTPISLPTVSRLYSGIDFLPPLHHHFLFVFPLLKTK